MKVKNKRKIISSIIAIILILGLVVPTLFFYMG